MAPRPAPGALPQLHQPNARKWIRSASGAAGNPLRGEERENGSRKNELRPAPPLLPWAQHGAWADLPPPSRTGARGHARPPPPPHGREVAGALRARPSGRAARVRQSGWEAGCQADAGLPGVQATEWLGGRGGSAAPMAQWRTCEASTEAQTGGRRRWGAYAAT